MSRYRLGRDEYQKISVIFRHALSLACLYAAALAIFLIISELEGSCQLFPPQNCRVGVLDGI